MSDRMDFSDPKRRRALKRAYDKAVKDGSETFTFMSREILTRYAHYLLEYLANETKDESLRPEI